MVHRGQSVVGALEFWLWALSLLLLQLGNFVVIMVLAMLRANFLYSDLVLFVRNRLLTAHVINKN